MDLHLRKEFHSMMEKISTARNLEHVTYPSFTLLQGFRTKYQAADYVYSMLALLSNGVRSPNDLGIFIETMAITSTFFLSFQSRNKTTSECFYDAMDTLSRYVITS